MTRTGVHDRVEAWGHLARPTTAAGTFEREDVVDLPAPAQRFLVHTIAPGTPLTTTVIMDMEGEIKLKQWMPFQARQVLRAGEGFVWQARVGKPPLVFRGGDAYWNGRGSLDFRMWGILPVARAAGPDIDRSAMGRLVAETVAWVPQSLVPRMGAVWTGIDSGHARVSLPVEDDTADIDVAVDATGRLRELTTKRWGDPDGGEFGLHTFGGEFRSHRTFSGVTIATEGRVGWWWGAPRQQEGEFFRYRLTDVRVAGTTPAPS